MKNQFKDIIKEVIEESKLSQQEFAKKIGTSQGTISKWTAGVQEPRFYQLQNIAITFGIDAEYLLGLKKY